MKLNNQSIEDLRVIIKQELKNVSNEERIHLDKELLEKLLFDEIVYNKNTGATLKLPIWSGEFLSKIDLSEVSFDNVAWSLIAFKRYNCGYDDLFDDQIWNKFNNSKQNRIYIGRNEYVCYKNTNANIDFYKSWEFKVIGKIKLVCCNFSGTDLSKFDMTKVNIIFNCILDNTNIKMPEMSMVNFTANNSSFVDISMNSYEIDLIDMLIGDGLFCECNLRNTGINIVYDKKNVIGQNCFFNQFKGSLDGCYLNGVLFNSTDKKKKSRKLSR